MARGEVETGEVVVAWGPRRAETLLLDRLLAEAGGTRQDPAQLALPLRVVVPSRSLRLHLGGQLVKRSGQAVLGLKIQTLSGLALEILDRSEQVAPLSDLLPLVVREQARAESPLRDSLDALADGYGAVEAAVVDLLDAGFEPVHAEAAEELLAATASPSHASERGRALVRVAARTVESLREQGVGLRSDLLARAAEWLERDPACLPTRRLFVHGFSDATGRATELVLALLRHRSAVVVLDTPPEPAALLSGSPQPPPEIFVDRFKERLAGIAPVQVSEDGQSSAPQVASLSAVGFEGESREVAQRIQRLLQDGIEPESIGVVARDRDSYASWVRLHFGELGVPYSGLAGTELGGPVSRRLAALGRLVGEREQSTTDAWLDARAEPSSGEVGENFPAWGAEEREELRLGFRRQGAGKLAQAARLPDFPNGMPLPLRRGFSSEDRAEGEAPVSLRRILAPELLGNGRQSARAAHDRLAAWPRYAPAKEHLARLLALAREDLGWSGDPELWQALESAVERIPAEGGPDGDVAAEDFALLLVRRLNALAGGELGGAGAGVQVLGVMEARGRTFEHLFVLGLNRDVFPRPIPEDALFPDELREALAALLPDIPIKRRGFDEERYLFAQLLASSSEVTLCWQHAGDDGRARAPSTLVERLRWAHPELLLGAPASVSESQDVRLPPREHALEAALAGGVGALAPLFPGVCEERERRVLAPHEERDSPASCLVDPAELSAARLAVLQEWDRAPTKQGGLGPFFGFVGATGLAADPRDGVAWITNLERLAACPWQEFLQRTLGVEPLPDPLGELPEVDRLVRGNLVHAVLDGLASDVLKANGIDPRERVSLGEWRKRAPISFFWPGDDAVRELLRKSAPRLLREQGLGNAGLEEVLARQAWQNLEVVRDAEWSGPGTEIPLLGCEISGEVQVGTSSIHFRADRLDGVDGALVFTDYKTGKFPLKGKKETTRSNNFLKKVDAGELLQAFAYARSTGDEGDWGRYLYLDPEPSEVGREVRADASDAKFVAAFEASLLRLLALRDAGAFFPRLIEKSGKDNEPQRCDWCEVSDACVRGDSGARRRLREWLQAGAAESSAEQATRAAWQLEPTRGAAPKKGEET